MMFASQWLSGAMFVSVAGDGWNSIPILDCPERTPSTDPCRLFHLSNNTLQGNVAEFGAGGMFASRPENMLVGCRSNRIQEWDNVLVAWKGDALTEENCIRFIDNTVRVCRSRIPQSHVIDTRRMMDILALMLPVGFMICSCGSLKRPS